MNSDAITKWLTLVANIGVVIGLTLVAYQIKQDSDLTRAVLFNEIKQHLFCKFGYPLIAC